MCVAIFLANSTAESEVQKPLHTVFSFTSFIRFQGHFAVTSGDHSCLFAKEQCKCASVKLEHQ